MLNGQWGIVNKILTDIGLEDYPWLVRRPTALGAAIVYHIRKYLPFWTLIFVAGRRAIPKELYEASDIDGAGTLQLFFHIYLPLILPSMFAIATYAFLYSWNEYLCAVLFLSGETNITIPVGMGNFLATDNPLWNVLMAESVLYSIPPVILYYCFRRHLLKGLVAGSVK